MILPTTMDWEQVTRASDEQLVAAYMRDGMARRQAEAFAAEIRKGSLGDLVE